MGCKVARDQRSLHVTQARVALRSGRARVQSVFEAFLFLLRSDARRSGQFPRSTVATHPLIKSVLRKSSRLLGVGMSRSECTLPRDRKSVV